MNMNKFFVGFLFMLLIMSEHVSAKVRFLTFHYNKPEFIEIQHKTFKKFMTDDYELIVFNDAKDPAIEKEIQQTCDKYGIQCVRFKQEWHEEAPLNDKIAAWVKNPKIYNPHTFISHSPKDIGQQASVRHCHVIRYAMENYGYNHDDIVGLIDGDAFLIKPLSARALLKDYDIAGIEKEYGSLNYFWVVFIVMDMRTFPNKKDLTFDMAVVNNFIHDTGSDLYHLLLNNPKIRYKKYRGVTRNDFPNKDDETLHNSGFNDLEIVLLKKENAELPLEFHLEKKVMHFSSSSYNLAGHGDKLTLVKEFVDKITAK